MGRKGRSSVVLQPKSTQEVSALLKYCNEQRLAVCPQGGNTGLVGGSTPVFDEVVISTSLMNKIISIDSAAGVLTCQSGCVLETLDQTLEQHGLMMPLDMGSKGSCNIGGNVATNAGGLRLLRYGSLHSTVLGLEVVQANGDILNLLSTLKKDNTGYHLKNLFIGSEGTIGMITAVALQCPPFPKAVNLAFLGLNSFEKVIETFRLAKSMVSEVLSAVEMMDASSVDACLEKFGYKRPIGNYPFYMVIETQGSHMEHDEEKLQSFLQKAMNESVVEDGVVASEPSKIRQLWEIRENIPVAIPKLGYTLKYDVSLPLKYFYSVVPEIQNRIGSEGHAFGYGHVGDGNIHLNIVLPKFNQEVVDKIEPYVYEFVSKYKGSISAEHGIGFRKREYIHYSKDEVSLNLMKQIKNMMDPNNIMNPYKVL
ncbi:D-2-hydroxyglutarate dehydrogenase, mitochondrial-like [Ctenocephalides felis]|uniref:D-2-hydroxyglutarate dehydrogenase, mitochondrial-like n=1 Tax=Ctenocephalides felis TaxID=7515 RepID=UPI000E6E2984|nr:D-2-hydroxyglutarate dehydrogenase, mitochondrial-like [Ctenocephalides felis]